MGVYVTKPAIIFGTLADIHIKEVLDVVMALFDRLKSPVLSDLRGLFHLGITRSKGLEIEARQIQGPHF